MSPTKKPHLVIIGRLRSMNKRQASLAVYEWGGVTRDTIDDQTDIVVQGIGYGKKLLKARKTNAIILQEKEFRTLLEGKTLEEILEERAPVDEQPLSDSFAHFREALADGPTCSAWEKLISLLDATPDEEQQAAVDYLLPHMQDWDRFPHESWPTLSYSEYPEDSPFWNTRPDHAWGENIEAGEVRVAPYHWMEEMLRGVDSPRWLLIRQLHLKGLKLNGKQGEGLLQLRGLRNLGILSLSWNEKLTARFYKKLRETEHLQNLKSLRLGKVTDKKIKSLQGPSTFQLKRLGLDSDYVFSPEAMALILSCECVKDIESIEMMEGDAAETWSRYLADNPGCLPHVTRFRQMFFRPTECTQALLNSGLTTQLTTLEVGCSNKGLGMTPLVRETLENLLDARHYPMLKHLDLQHMYARVYQGPTEQEVQEWLLDILPQSGLLSQLQTLTLGSLATPACIDMVGSTSVTLL